LLLPEALLQLPETALLQLLRYSLLAEAPSDRGSSLKLLKRFLKLLESLAPF
jgi:hypothetical protein